MLKSLFIIFFYQLLGEAIQKFLEINIPPHWIVPIYESGYTSKELLLEAKPTAVHQKLNGYRKKNKLDVPAILLEQVQSWYK